MKHLIQVFRELNVSEVLVVFKGWSKSYWPQVELSGLLNAHSNTDDIDKGNVFDMLVNGLLPTNTTLNSGISI